MNIKNLSILIGLLTSCSSDHHSTQQQPILSPSTPTPQTTTDPSPAPLIVITSSPLTADQQCKNRFGEFAKIQVGNQCECIPGYEWGYSSPKSCILIKHTPIPIITKTPTPQFKIVAEYREGGYWCVSPRLGQYRTGTVETLISLENLGCRFYKQVGDIHYCSFEGQNCSIIQRSPTLDMYRPEVCSATQHEFCIKPNLNF